jgi:hypothetical protein
MGKWVPEERETSPRYRVSVVLRDVTTTRSPHRNLGPSNRSSTGLVLAKNPNGYCGLGRCGVTLDLGERQEKSNA